MQNNLVKIVQIVESFGGGVYSYVLDLCNFLADYNQKNIQVYLIYSSKRKEFIKEHFLNNINNKVKFYEVNLIRNINPKKDFQDFKIIRNILKEINPDVIHLHSSKASVIGRIAAWNLVKKNKIFYSPHCYAFNQQNISSLKKIFFKAIEFIMPVLFGGITVTSGQTEYQSARKITNKLIMIKNGINFYISNQINNQINNQKIEKTNNNKLIIGTLGRIDSQKNPQEFNEIALKFPEFDFIWIGQGNLKNQLTSKNIKITGWISDKKQILDKLNNLDIYLQTSLWEGLPISIIEAMSLKKALIVSNVIGNKDTVINGLNGFTYNNINQAIEKINILKNNETRHEMGENSYKIANKEYNQNINFVKLTNEYLK